MIRHENFSPIWINEDLQSSSQKLNTVNCINVIPEEIPSCVTGEQSSPVCCETGVNTKMSKKQNFDLQTQRHSENNPPPPIQIADIPTLELPKLEKTPQQQPEPYCIDDYFDCDDYDTSKDTGSPVDTVLPDDTSYENDEK